MDDATFIEYFTLLNTAYSHSFISLHYLASKRQESISGTLAKNLLERRQAVKRAGNVKLPTKGTEPTKTGPTDPLPPTFVQGSIVDKADIPLAAAITPLQRSI